MLKYVPIALLVCLAISCKKEPVNNTPSTPNNPQPEAAVFSLLDADGNCNIIQVDGEYKADVPMNQENRIVLKVNVTQVGSYSINISSGNGYGFNTSGSFTATGEQYLPVPGRGTPVNGNINTLTVTAGGNSCSFAISVISNAPLSNFEDNDHMYFGNPSRAAVNADSINNYLLRKPYYAVSYSRDRGTPNWVSWHLYAADLGTISRQEDFRPDNTLPDGWYQVPPTAYSNSGFDKGHNTPSGDRTISVDANSSTFLMTNMIPQAPTNNQVVWARLEDSLRRLATLGYEVYIIMGNYGVGGTGNNGFVTTLDAGRVTVPANIWKVAVVLPNGNNDSSRVTSSTRVIAVDVPNTNALGFNWKAYRVSVDAIEAATGLNLLSRLPESLQAELESRVDNL